MQIRRHLTLFFLVFALMAQGAAAKDFRTAFVRVVPETDWKPEKSQAIALEVVNAAAHEDSGAFATALSPELTEQFGRVLGFTLDPKSPIKVKFTVSEFDPGKAALRLGLGFGGKSYVGGEIEVRDHDKVIGRLLFSFQPTTPGAAAMARESASVLALKVSNGDRDKELHAMKTKKK